MRALVVLASVAALTTAACGGAAPAPARAPAYEGRDKTPADDTTPEPRTIEEAEEQIARARAMLDARRATKTQTETEPRPEPLPAPQGGAAPASRPDRDDACGSPCRALASMKRAVEALCRMTGDTDDRCLEAKRTLDESTSRVAACRCEAR